MKQQSDTRTIEAFPLPPRRGRKPSGAAKTPAQRVAEHKQRKDEAGAAMRSELLRLRQRVGQLEADNKALAAELVRLSAPKRELLSGLAGPLAAFFDESGIPHELS